MITLPLPRLLLLGVLLVLAGCGKETTSKPGETTGGPTATTATTPPDASPTGERGAAPAGPPREAIQPVPAREHYPERTAAEILSDVRRPRGRGRTTERLPEADWLRTVSTVMEEQSLATQFRSHRVDIDASVLDVVQAQGTDSDAWIRIERLTGGNEELLAERAAMYITPIDHPMARVEPVAIPGVSAYRSMFGGSDGPVIAWLHRGLFVCVGRMDTQRAAAIHENLSTAGAYGKRDSASGPAVDPEDPILGTWQAPNGILFTFKVDGWWEARRKDAQVITGKGRWEARRIDYLVHFPAGMNHPPAVATFVSRDALRLDQHDGAYALTRYKQGARPSVDPKPAEAAASRLVGDWLGPDDVVVRFKSDGTWEGRKLGKDRVIVSGRWRRDGDRFVVDPPEGVEQPPARVSFQKDGTVVLRQGEETFALRRLTPEEAAASSDAASPASLPKDRTPKAVLGHASDEALAWLAAHQAEDGGWRAARFGEWCNGRRTRGATSNGAGQATFDVGATGLALCAFLAAGHRPRREGPQAAVLRRGLAWLIRQQDAEGCFGDHRTERGMLSHASAALAMVQAATNSKEEAYMASARKALAFIYTARNPYFAWGRGVKPGTNDTSRSGWLFLPIAAARNANRAATFNGEEQPFEVKSAAFEGMRSWLNRVTDEDYGRVGYDTKGGEPYRPEVLRTRFPGSASEETTALGLLCRLLMGERVKKGNLLERSVHLLAKKPPGWNTQDGSIDLHYWYFGTFAMMLAEQSGWKTWHASLLREVVPQQHVGGEYCDLRGSWDPMGVWGQAEGRVASTALLCITLRIAAGATPR